VGGRPDVIVARPCSPTFVVEGGPVLHRPHGHLLVPAVHQPAPPVEQALEHFAPEAADARLEHEFWVSPHYVERIELHAVHASEVRECAVFTLERTRREEPLVREEESTCVARRYGEVRCRLVLPVPRTAAGHHDTVEEGRRVVNRDALLLHADAPVSVRWLDGRRAR
jgi:hypothetical protein